MCRGLSTSLVETAQLLVSELVTNALDHGQGAVGLSISRRGDVLRVEVSDASKGPVAQVLRADFEDGSGRGLFLLAALASSWGREPVSDARSTVWFELDPPDAAPDSPLPAAMG